MKRQTTNSTARTDLVRDKPKREPVQAGIEALFSYRGGVYIVRAVFGYGWADSRLG